MEKYKVIAEKITYSLDGYIADHNNRNFGDADGWLRHVRNGWEEFIEAHPDSLNLHEYLQHQQAKVEKAQTNAELLNEALQRSVAREEELQKRVDKAIRLLVEAELYQSEPNIDLAVKALKGEG
ncbi:hypothetical protein ACUN5M_000333 [Acinetobacter baumannii]